MRRGVLFAVDGDALGPASSEPAGLAVPRHTAALLLQLLGLPVPDGFSAVFDARRFGRRVAMRLGRPRLVAFDEAVPHAGAVAARLPPALATSWVAHDVFDDAARLRGLRFVWVDARTPAADAASVLGDELLALCLDDAHLASSVAHRCLSMAGNEALGSMLETLLALATRAVLSGAHLRLSPRSA